MAYVWVKDSTKQQLFFHGIHAYYVPIVDKWRVVLKGETPDYINASSVHVRQLSTYQNSGTSQCWFFLGRAINRRGLSSSLRAQ